MTHPDSHARCLGAVTRGESLPGPRFSMCICPCHDEVKGPRFLDDLWDDHYSWSVRDDDGTITKFRHEKDARAFAADCREITALRTYEAALARGLSDAEAREEAWPTPVESAPIDVQDSGFELDEEERALLAQEEGVIA